MPARLMEELVPHFDRGDEVESVLTRMENESVSIDTVLLERSGMRKGFFWALV